MAGGSGGVLLVDASPYIFRAYFALPSSLVDPQGRPANAVYGFTSFLIKLIAEEEPTHLAVAFDRSLTTSFRNELYADYKGQRELPPPELEAQLDRCREVTVALGAQAFIDDRYEADDLLASLCDAVAPAAVTVVTSDKDLAQLVSERVMWFDYGRNTRYGVGEVRDKLGIEPERLTDLLGLAGDPVDNIPGVRGIGAKTALALLADAGSLEALCREPEGIADMPLRGASRLSRLIAEQGDMALLSKELATVVRDLPLGVELDDLVLAPPDGGALEALFAELGFASLRDRALEGR